MNQTFSITGMNCGKCVARVTAALKPFADDVSVTLNPPRAILGDSHGATLDVLNREVAKVGTYTLTPIVEAPASPVSTELPANSERTWLETYKPLLIIVGYILIASLAAAASSLAFSWQHVMTSIMAGFFLVFSGFKFLNLRGFADAYATYDLLAKRWHAWGFIYPFLELALGLAYLTGFAPQATNMATVALMGFSSLGVIDALRHNRKIQCACLGTVLNLPMSTITLVEDLAMVAMAAMALAFGHN